MGIERLDKRDQYRITHEFIDNSDGLSEFGRVRGRGPTRQAQQIIANVCWKIDLARAVRLDVGLNKLLP